MNDSSARVAVVIVNYKTAALVVDCLRSLEDEVGTIPRTRVIVVDNASGDGSADTIGRAVHAGNWESWVTLVPLEHNGGFSAGNNVALRLLMQDPFPPEWILLLNPDTVVRPGALAALLQFGDQREDVGIVGSRLEDPDGSPQYSAFRFPSILSTLEEAICTGPVTALLQRWKVVHPVSDVPLRCDWVAGASMLLRRRMIERIGLFDEGYFLYYEEVDLCLRAARAGWSCWYEPRSRVVHLVGQATGVTDAKKARVRRPRYWFDSRLRYFLKHHGVVRTGLVDGAWMAGLSVGEIIRMLRRRPSRLPERFFMDFLRQSVFVRGGKL